MHLRTRLFHSALLAISLIPLGARAGLAHSAPALDPRAIQADGLTPLFTVPFPQSLLLLDVLEGTRRGEAWPRRAHYPECWNGAPAFDPESSAALLELVLGASQEELRLLREMRGLAVDRLDLGGPPRTRRESLPQASAVVEFRRRLQALERLVQTAHFRGHALLTGTTPVMFLFQPSPSGEPQRIILFDLSTSTHGLTGLDIVDETEAASALDLIDTALVYVDTAHACYLLDRQTFEDGPPEGGLLAVAAILERLHAVALQAADAHLDSQYRSILDSRFQSDVSRLDQLSARAHFENIPLLRGGLVLLHGAGTLEIRPFLLPNTGAMALDIDTDITDVDNALGALGLLDAARAYVSEQLAALACARAQLHRSGPRRR